MELTYFGFISIILYSFVSLITAKPFDEEKQFSEDNNKLHCMDSNNAIDEQKNNLNSFYDNKPRLRYDSYDNLANKFSDYDKRKLAVDGSNEGLESSYLQKRQVGVVYKDEMPIGILQPDKRSYRFVPIKDDQLDSSDYGAELDDQFAHINKRDVSNTGTYKRNQLYPIILTNFKIGDKLDKKRNDDSLKVESDTDLSDILRDTRSANSGSLQFEKKLENILDDMGLIDNEEKNYGKRETVKDENDLSKGVNTGRRKRDESCVHRENENDAKRTQIQSNEKFSLEKEDSGNSILNRKKRLKEVLKNHKFATDDDSIDTNPETNSSRDTDIEPKIGRRNVNRKVTDDENETYEDRVERQIEEKINNLKEEVKREINKMQQISSNSNSNKQKRSSSYDLNYEEEDEVNPALNVDDDLKPLIRKRRGALSEETSKSSELEKSKIKREIKRSDGLGNKDSTDGHGLIDDDSEDLLGGDDLESKSMLKRELPDLNVYVNEDFDDGNGAANINYEKYKPLKQWRTRRRRKIDQNVAIGNRPQQLSDMSDFDLFGALPKSYQGELSRYKRVKRK